MTKAEKETNSLSLEEAEYDPHKHRNRPHPTTNMETLIHLLKGSLGTGILAMPEAFVNAGMVNGWIFTFFIGFLCTYCLHILVKSQYIICKQLRVPVLTYQDSMKEALLLGPNCLKRCAPIAPSLTIAFLVVYQVGICCVYYVFVAENIKKMCDYYFDKMGIEWYMLILLVPFFMINSIRNLKLLAPFSTLANVITFIGFGIVVYYVVQDMPDINETEAFGTAYAFPLFFGTVLFALEAVGVIISLENNMKTPQDFRKPAGVLNLGMVVITILYVGMGFLGYWKYGKGSLPSITLNLPQEEILAQSVQVMFAIAVYISYGLQAFPAVDIVWNAYFEKRMNGSKYKLFWEYILRYTTVIITFILAVAIPRLGLFISLVGAFCLSALGLAFPAIMEFCVCWPNQLGRFYWVLIKDFAIIIIGIIGLICGTYSSVSEIVRSFIVVANTTETSVGVLSTTLNSTQI